MVGRRMGLASVVAVGESSIFQKLTLGLSKERMRFLRISVQQDSKRMYARRETKREVTVDLL